MSVGSTSRHETFPLRYTWLAKGVRASSVLDSDQAMAELGVEKNMVRSVFDGINTTVLEKYNASENKAMIQKEYVG